MIKKITIWSLLWIGIDQILKVLVANFIPFQKEIEIIPNFFYLTNVHNEGAAWSILSGNLWLLIGIAIFVLIGIYYFLIKNNHFTKMETFLYSLLIGGIVGNLLDRILYGYVVDYLSFIFGSYYYPIFNFADMMIVVSIVLLVGMSIKEEYLCKKSK